MANAIQSKAEQSAEDGPSERALRIEGLLSGIDRIPSWEMDWETVGELSEDYGLTAYDASDLAVALEQPDPLLVTEDESLLEASRIELGVDRAHDAVTALQYVQDGRL